MTLRRYLTRGLLGAGLLLNPLSISGCSEIITMLTPKLDKAEAEQVLQKEKNELGIDFPVEFQWGELYDVYGSCGKHPNQQAAVILANPRNIDETTIRHELYHIARHGIMDENSKYESGRTFEESMKKKEERRVGLIKLGAYFFYYEPSACIYSHLGIKL